MRRIREADTDLWVFQLLQDVGLSDNFTPQGSSIREINEALLTASKRGTGNIGFPEFVGVVKDFLIVIENKAKTENHVKRDESGLIMQDVQSITSFAVNGALFYGIHLSQNTSYKKIISIGISGNEKYHVISPIFVDERGNYRELKEIETFVSFREDNIVEYYERQILEVKTDHTLRTEEILKIARGLHEDLRNFGNLEDKSKPLIVSGILLALSEIEHKNFDIEDLNGDRIRTDGIKIYKAIEDNLRRVNVSPEVKRDKLLSQFNVIKSNNKINEINSSLGKTPLKHFTQVLYDNIFRSIKYNFTSEDYVGRFYGEFMSYSGGDGQTLGIILTPKHVTELFCDLLDLQIEDRVFDPCCGTGGFLIAALHSLLSKTEDEATRRNIRRDQLYGIELQDYMFTIATTNMILRGDGKSNLENLDFLAQNPSQLQLKGCTVGMMNPPYSQGSRNNPELYEISFIERLLSSLVPGAKAAVIVPQSTFTGKTNYEKNVKKKLLKHHTLEGVITLNRNTFYGVGTNPCIGIFTTGIPHDKAKECKFINFEDDGYIVSKHIGLIDDGSAKDKKQHLIDVWKNLIEAPTKFCVKTKVEHTDEWLHSFFYFNDEIPEFKDFNETMANYLTFEFKMVTHSKLSYFSSQNEMPFYDTNAKLIAQADNDYDVSNIKIDCLNWAKFKVDDPMLDFKIINSKPYHKQNLQVSECDGIPYITRTSLNNGLDDLVIDEEYDKTKGKSVSFGAENVDFFYQEHDYIAGNKMYSIQHNKINRYVGLFLARVFKQSVKDCGFGYGQGLTGTRFKTRSILLPIDLSGKPDWQFMEVFMKNIENELLNNAKKYFFAQIEKK